MGLSESQSFFLFEPLVAPVRPQIFFSRTVEKLGRMCDQIGRTLEPCILSTHFTILTLVPSIDSLVLPDSRT